MTTLEVLRAARKLIEREEDWKQEGGYDPDGPWCAVTATGVPFDGVITPTRTAAVGTLQRLAGGLVSRFNDTHTHAEVLDLFDRAIAIEEEQDYGEPLPSPARQLPVALEFVEIA